MKVTLLLCKNRGQNEKAIPAIVEWERTIDRELVDDVDISVNDEEKFALKFEFSSLFLKENNNNAHDKSQGRQYFGAMLSAFFARCGMERILARER